MTEINEIVSTIENGAEILEALSIRNNGLGDKRQWQQFLDMEYSADYFPQPKSEWKVEKTRLEAQRALGEQYFQQGYRLKQTHREIRGITHIVPAEALVWRMVLAGYIATREAVRIEYVTQKDETS